MSKIVQVYFVVNQKFMCYIFEYWKKISVKMRYIGLK